MAANPLAEKRRLRKLENQQLEVEAKRRQEELRNAQTLELQRIERERAAALEAQQLERERIQLARQTELDRTAQLELEERMRIERIEMHLRNVGAFCTGELPLPGDDSGNAKDASSPLSVAVAALSALDPPVSAAIRDDAATPIDTAATDTIALVADARGQLHAFALSSRMLLFTAVFAADASNTKASPLLAHPSAMDRHSCVFIDLRILFALYRTAVTPSDLTGDSSNSDSATGVQFEASTAIAFALGDAQTALFASPRGVAFDDTAREIFVSDQLHHCVAVYALAAGIGASRAQMSTTQRVRLTRVRAFGSRGHGDAQLQRPSGLDASHYHVVVCDTGNCRLVVFAKRGAFVCSYGGRGTRDGAFHDLRDVKLVHVRKRVPLRSQSLAGDNACAITSEQFEIVVADTGNCRVQILNERGAFLRQLSLLGGSDAIEHHRSQLIAVHATLLHEFAALETLVLPTLDNAAAAATPSIQLQALAHRLHPSSAAYVRITAAQVRYQELQASVHHPLALAIVASAAVSTTTAKQSTHEVVVVDHVNANVLVYSADGARTKWLGLDRATLPDQQHGSQQHTHVLSSVHSVLQLEAIDAHTILRQRRLFVSDSQSHRVAVFDASTLAFLFYVGASTYGAATLRSSGFLPGELQHPTFLTTCVLTQPRSADAGDNEPSPLLLVSDSGNHCVSVFDAASGQFVCRIGAGYGHVGASMDSPQGVTVLLDRWLFVCDQRNHRVQLFDVLAIAIDADTTTSNSGGYVGAFGREGSAPGELRFPTDVAVCPALPSPPSDAACDFGAYRDAKVVVSDAGNHRVQVFAVPINVATAMDFALLLVLNVHATLLHRPLEPVGVCVEHRSGCILVTDAASQCVLVFRRDGSFLTTFGATGSELTLRCERPVGLTLHGATLFVADAGRRDVSVFELVG